MNRISGSYGAKDTVPQMRLLDCLQSGVWKVIWANLRLGYVLRNAEGKQGSSSYPVKTVKQNQNLNLRPKAGELIKLGA